MRRLVGFVKTMILKVRIADTVGQDARRKAIKTILVRLDEQFQRELDIENLAAR